MAQENIIVIIVGAGAAGLMAAVAASESRSKKVLVLEKNQFPGKKLLITGKGRCNITNTADFDELINNIPGNGNFLYSSFRKFSNFDIINFFEENGLKTKNERGGRVFPSSDSAADIVEVLRRKAVSQGVIFNFNTEVISILTVNNTVTGVRTKYSGDIACNSLIIATGGTSYKATGSTGDGYKLSKEVGHTITPISPSLVPLETKEKWVENLMGLSLKNVTVTFFHFSGKKIYEDFGEMLFTHFGVSGPIILSASRHLLPYSFKNIILKIDLKPALDQEKLDLRLQRDFEQFSNKQFKNALNNLLPAKMIPVFVELCQIPGSKPVNQLTRQERQVVCSVLKALPLEITSARPIDEAIVTSGGISVLEINPKNMESKKIKGLYFAGEVMDVDGYTGGFNLTIAFSTGHCAGSSTR